MKESENGKTDEYEEGNEERLGSPLKRKKRKTRGEEAMPSKPVCYSVQGEMYYDY